MRLRSHYPKPGMSLRSAFSHWLAYRRAYSNNWQGVFVPRLRRGLYRKAAGRLASALPQNAHILDIGTGPGHLLVAIARQQPHATLRGIDISPHMTYEARRVIESAGLTGRITIQQADAAALPFDTATFDCVISMMSYHLWEDPPRGLAEARRVLKPGGSLHLYVGRWEAYPGRLPILDYFNHTSGTTLAAALRSAGFVTVDVSYPRRQRTYLFASATRPLSRWEPVLRHPKGGLG